MKRSNANINSLMSFISPLPFYFLYSIFRIIFKLKLPVTVKCDQSGNLSSNAFLTILSDLSANCAALWDAGVPQDCAIYGTPDVPQDFAIGALIG
jgi:hypothetical protein